MSPAPTITREWLAWTAETLIAQHDGNGERPPIGCAECTPFLPGTRCRRLAIERQLLADLRDAGPVPLTA